MRAFPAEYLNLKLRAHELLHDVPLYDVSVVDLPGGGDGRSVGDIRALDSAYRLYWGVYVLPVSGSRDNLLETQFPPSARIFSPLLDRHW